MSCFGPDDPKHTPGAGTVRFGIRKARETSTQLLHAKLHLALLRLGFFDDVGRVVVNCNGENAPALHSSHGVRMACLRECMYEMCHVAHPTTAGPHSCDDDNDADMSLC